MEDREVLSEAFRPGVDPLARGPASIAGILAQVTRHLAWAAIRERVYYSGTRHIVLQPEFSTPSRLAPIFGLLDEGVTLGRMLARLTRGGRLTVRIGRENPLEAVRSCTLIAMRLSAGAADSIGVLGPTRMDYPGVVARLELLGEILGESGTAEGTR